MSDEEYRRRYIERLVLLLETKGRQPHEDAVQIAEDGYEVCPRADMDSRWQDDPEGCAEESYIEWRDSDRDSWHDY